jgi:hypothetical protein
VGMSSAQRKELTERRTAAGLCNLCGKQPSAEGMRVCETCRGSIKAGQQARRGGARPRGGARIEKHLQPSGTVEIEDGIPIPPRQMPTPAPPVWPFDRLEIGQSFRIPVDDPDPRVASEVADRARKLATGYARRHPGHWFVVRTVEGGVRVWRTEARH